MIGGMSKRLLALGTAVLLLIDTFVPWQKLSVESFSYSWNAWHGDKGILLGVLTIALIVLIGARTLGVPLASRVADGPTMPALALLVLVFAAVKNMRDEDSAWGGYLGVALAVGVAATALLAYRELRSSPEASAAAPQAP